MVNGTFRHLVLLFVGPAVFLLLLILGEASAWAKDAAGSTTLVIVVDGRGAEKVRTEMFAELPGSWTPADTDAVASAARERKLPAGLGALGDPKTKDGYVQKLAQVATDVGARGAVAIQMAKGKKRVAHVVLISAAGATLVDTQVTLKAPGDDAAAVTQAFAQELAALPAAEPAAPATASPAATTPTTPNAPPDAQKPAAPTPANPPPAPPAPPVVESPPVFEGALTMEIGLRHLSFRDVTTGNIPNYDSGLVPTPALALDLFPFARGDTVVLQDFGLFGDFKYGLGASDTLSNGTKVSITWVRFDVGLKYRFFFFGRNWRAPVFAFSVSYGQELFDFRNKSPPPGALDTPSADYQIIRPRVEARLPLGPLVVLVGAGYLGVLDAGDFVTNIRSPSVYAWEADLVLAVPLGGAFALRAGVGYRRFVHQFGPQEGDPYIANVATDQILRADVGISVHF